MTALPKVEDEARRVLRAAAERKVSLKLIGGVGIAIRCPSSQRPGLQRSYVDMDLVGHERQSKKIQDLFAELGYSPRERFNAMMGRKRLIFNDMVNQRRADIFLDVFEMSHKFDLSGRVDLEPWTLPLADLVATKLQVVQINEKDFKDLLTLFMDHDVDALDGEKINGAYLAKLCSGDWGTYKTLTMNLDKLREFTDGYELDPGEKTAAKARMTKLTEAIEKEPKSLGWKVRARVGESVAWYELPEADRPVVSG